MPGRIVNQGARLSCLWSGAMLKSPLWGYSHAQFPENGTGRSMLTWSRGSILHRQSLSWRFWAGEKTIGSVARYAGLSNQR